MSEELKQPTKCRECGGSSLTWAADNQNSSGVQDGRLRMHDVRGVFVLGCDDCSETLAVVSADKIAAHLNTRPPVVAEAEPVEVVAYLCNGGKRVLLAADKKEAVWNAGHPLMEVAQHHRIVAALTAPPASGAVPVHLRPLLERIAHLCMHTLPSADYAELRHLLANSKGVK